MTIPIIKAGDIIYPEDNEVKYPFVPLHKDGELIGYGSWVNTIIYSHPEVDVISGSTISSQTFFFEMRNMLTVFEGFGPGAE